MGLLDQIRLVPLQLKASKRAIPVLIILVILTESFITILQAWTPDPEPDYELFIIPFVKQCDVLQYPQRERYDYTNGTVQYIGEFTDSRNPLKWWINCVSYKVFDTPKFIPILFNLGLMPLVYLLAVQITKDKVIGLLSFGAFVANPLYSQWLSSGTYDQVWSFFFILSVYLMYKFKDGGLPFLSLFASLTAKTLGLLYLPAWYYTYLKTESSKARKIMFSFILFASLGVFALVYYDNFDVVLGGQLGFYPENTHDIVYRNFEMLWNIVPFLVAFTLLATNFRPISPSPHKKIVALWMLNGLLTTVMIYLFSTQFQFVYRFVPFAVFMSLFIGIVIVDTGKCIVGLILKRQARREK